MSKSYLRRASPLLVNLATLLALCLAMLCAKAEELEKSPELPLVFRLLDNNVVSIDIVNVKDLRKSFILNIENAIGHTFMGFPKRAGIQYRNLEGDIIRVDGSRKDGWLHPDIFGAEGDLPEDTMRVDLMSEISIPPHEVVSFVIKGGAAYRVARYGIPTGKDRPTEFRVKLRLNVMVDKLPSPKEIVSPWFPYKFGDEIE